MKIQKWIDLGSQEVDIEVCAEDVVRALLEEPGGNVEYHIKHAANNLALVFRKFPDEEIAKLSLSVRCVIGNFLREQSDRFLPPQITDPHPGSEC